MICGYNWSARKLNKAIINGQLLMRAPASDVYRKLEKITPAETKNYLKWVTQFTREFQGKRIVSTEKSHVKTSSYCDGTCLCT